jgi:hypothetical protein
VQGQYISASTHVPTPEAGNPTSYAVYNLSPSQRYRVVNTWKGGDVMAVSWYQDTITHPNRRGDAHLGQNTDTYFLNGDSVETMPVDANRLVINFNTGTTPYVLAEKLVSSTAARTLPIPMVSTGRQSGRGKVLILGTSIDAANFWSGCRGELGLTINNQALGGGMYRAGYYANQQATGDDIYGFTGVDWNAAIRSLSMDGPVDAFPYQARYGMLNGWPYWASKLGNSPPASVSEDMAALINGSGYDTRLDPYITPTVDVNQGYTTFVLGAPFNDWNSVPGNDAAKNADMLVVNPADDFDRTTVFGAMNWIIRRIYERCLAHGVQPIIGLMGHYEDQRASGIRQVQQMVADYWSIPLYPLYDRLGVSTKTITVSGSSTTTYAQLLPDNVHPHSDPKGRIYARQRQHAMIALRDWFV